MYIFTLDMFIIILYTSGKYCVSHLNNCTHTVDYFGWVFFSVCCFGMRAREKVMQSAFNQGNGTRTIWVPRERMQIFIWFLLEGASLQFFFLLLCFIHSLTLDSILRVHFFLFLFLWMCLTVISTHANRKKNKRCIYSEKVYENECKIYEESCFNYANVLSFVNFA